MEMLRLSRTSFALTLLLGALLLPASPTQAKSVKPNLSSVTVAGQNITIKGSVKLPAKKTLKGKKLKLRVTLKATAGKPQTRDAKIKAKRTAATVKFKLSVLAKATGKLKITAQLYLGKKKFGKASKSKSVTVTAPIPGAGAASGLPLSVGGGGSCAALGDNFRCWGAGQGYLGDGTTDPRPFPVTILTGLSTYLYRFSVGGTGGCVLVNGYAKCWGRNYNGEIGDGTSGVGEDRYAPTQVQGITGGGSSISSGNGHTCAINNLKLYCWGRNDWGQIGNNTFSSSNGGSPSPEEVDMTGMGTPYSVAAGGSNSCANTSNGIWCWGQNNQGQLGIGTHDGTRHMVPEHVGGVLAGIANFVNADLSVGSDHVCAQLGGHAYCWGYNGYGQLGTTTVGTESDVPVSPDVLPIDAVASISAGVESTCALALGTAYCWGLNDQGQIGIGSIGGNVTAPTPVVGLEHDVGSVSAGWFHSCGSKGTTVLCWGANGGGNYLGNGSSQDTGTPVAVQGL